MSPPNEYTDIRDAVIKLETKMEVMSDSIVSLADSVSKIADVRYELVVAAKDISNIKEQLRKIETDIDMLFSRQRNLEDVQKNHGFVISKVDAFWTALITGAAAFIWWVIKG